MARRRRSPERQKEYKKAAKLKKLLRAPEPQPITGLKSFWSGVVSDTPPGFYVYRLSDPRDGLTFYVGKGQRDRAWRHELLVRAGRSAGNPSKCERIQQIVDAGLAVRVIIVAAYVLESDALEHEWRLVDSLPDLTNLMPGGIGAAQTPDQITRRQVLRQRKLDEVRRREREEARLREIDRNVARIPGADTAEGVEWAQELRQSTARLTYAPRQSTKRSKVDLAVFRATKPKPERD